MREGNIRPPARPWAGQWPPLTHGGGIAVGVFLVEYILLYKKSEELHLEPAAFLQGGSLKTSRH